MWMQIQTYHLKEPFADIYSDDYLDPHRTTENVFAQVQHCILKYIIYAPFAMTGKYQKVEDWNIVGKIEIVVSLFLN